MSGTLRVLPLGGVGEIGKNMTVVEYDGRIVVVDTGLMFPAPDQLGIDLVLPDFAYLAERADDIEVAGEAADGEEALRPVRADRPDVVLMDIRMPGLDGLEATRRLLAAAGRTAPRVIVLTTFDFEKNVYEALKAGASGFLLKDTEPERLVEGIRTVARGETLLAPAVTRRLIARVAGSNQDRRIRARERLALLNDREREVAVAVGQGRSNAEIGAVLFLSVPTVKTHVSSILTKLDLNNRVQIALLAHDAGLLDDPPG